MNRVTLLQGDCVEEMAKLPEASVSAVVTDPPYKLSFMGRAWDEAPPLLALKDVAFRAWLAGLIAGEGCFRIHKEKSGDYYACHFQIKMRADEAPLLYALARRVGAGSVSVATQESNHLSDNPMASWVIQSRSDCWKLARLLDGVPLYAKKQREYDVWRKALQEWTDRPRGNRWHGSADKSRMAALYEEMRALRPFDQELAESAYDPLIGGAYADHYQWAKQAFRVLKPGGHLLAFGGTRTFHRLVCALEDAGFEIRDTLMWMYGSGFAKSMDVSKAMDRAQGVVREDKFGGSFQRRSGPTGNKRCDECGKWLVSGNPCSCPRPQDAAVTESARRWQGWGTALKPAYEPIVLARKPLSGTVASNVLAHGTGALNIDACRIVVKPGDENGSVAIRERAAEKGRVPNEAMPHTEANRRGVVRDRSSVGAFSAPRHAEALGRWPANVLLQHSPECQMVGEKLVKAPGGVAIVRDENSPAGGYSGLPPRPIGLRLSKGDADGMETVEDWRCVEGCPVRMLDEQSGVLKSGFMRADTRRSSDGGYHGGFPADRVGLVDTIGDSGGASRFFYTAKAPGSERWAWCGTCACVVSPEDQDSHRRRDHAIALHPTVKPVALMAYLVTLVTPPGGTVLDPFMGSGSTGVACADVPNVRFVGIERDETYFKIARARLLKATEQGDLWALLA